MKENPVLEKSFAFALRIVKLYKYLCDERAEYVLSKSALTAGTHVGKHVKEALSGESRQVFIGEMAVALKKASETEYWLELLRAAGYLDEKAFVSINADCQELIKLLTSIVKTSKSGSIENV
jgi:four helix bundle protein